MLQTRVSRRVQPLLSPQARRRSDGMLAYSQLRSLFLVVRGNACLFRDPSINVCSETYSCRLLQSTDGDGLEVKDHFTHEQIEEYKEAFALFDRAGVGECRASPEYSSRYRCDSDFYPTNKRRGR